MGLLVGDADPLWNAPVFALIGFAAAAGWPYLAQKMGLLSPPERTDQNLPTQTSVK